MSGVDPKVGIIGFAEGLRVIEPNPSNVAIAREVVSAAEYAESYESVPIVVTQWEVTKALKERFDFDADLSVELRTDGTYLNSRMVWEEAKAEFGREGVTQVIIIAQPYLHLPSLKRMVRADNYEVFEYKFGTIPFDDSDLNTQPWTRNKAAYTKYAVKKLREDVYDAIVFKLTGKKPERVRMQHDT